MDVLSNAGLFAHMIKYPIDTFTLGILRMYADTPNNYLSSNAGLFAQVHRHMDVICVCTQIFLKLILNVQHWIICAYDQVYHRDTDVSVKN